MNLIFIQKNIFFQKLYCRCDRKVVEALKRFSKFWSNYPIAHFFINSDGGEIFLFILKVAFKTKALYIVVWKKLTVTVNALVEFLNCRVHPMHEKEAATQFSTEWLFWKFQAWQGPLLARKFQVAGPQIYQEGAASPLFSKWFCENFQNSPHLTA